MEETFGLVILRRGMLKDEKDSPRVEISTFWLCDMDSVNFNK
jgi:hypothetical protein